MTPSLITNRLHNICKHLTLGRQEDAHEFLRYLVEQMEKSFLQRFKSMPNFKEMDQYSKETTPLNQILGGYLRSTVTCLACKHESITFQHFEDLPLDITRVSTLNEALAGYFARENLEECGYKCESCKRKVSATKRFSLERAPVVLCIQLKRFNVMGGKLGKQIQISQNLDLTKHLAKSSEQNQNCSYRLVSMVTHLGGSASGGHYTAIGITPNGNFCHFDDSCVSPISTENVLRTNAYVLFYEVVQQKPKQNGNTLLTHSSIHQHEHTYSKIAPSTTTSSSPAASRSDFDRLREGFAKPNLPKMIPTSIIRHNQQIKQKESDTAKMQPSTSKAVVQNGHSKAPPQPSPVVKTNGKREASDDEGEKEEVAAKKLKPSLPSLPRLTTEDASPQKTPLTPSTLSPASAPSTPQKPKSLVPYETDDEDEEPATTATTNGTSNGSAKKAEADRVNFFRTSSGVFVETDAKEYPSKHGSTVDKTIITKASLTNGSASNGPVNGKTQTNGYHVKRNDDTIQQLTKLNHSGYGNSDVVSWSNTPSVMNREVEKDVQEDRKRQLDNQDDMEMDAGRVKKIKYGSNRPLSNDKLPNPFQEQQNVHNQNGNSRPQQMAYFDRSKNNFNRNPNSYQNGNNRHGHNNGGGRFKPTFKPRDNNFHNYNRHNGGGGGGGGKFNNNKQRFNDRR